jgi:hypothetical protein
MISAPERSAQMPSCSMAAARELADGRGLAGAVHADDQQHERLLLRDVERLLRGKQDGGDGVSERGDERVDVLELGARHLLAQLFEDLRGGIDADVGREQTRLELVEDLRVDLPAGYEIREVVRQPRPRTIDLRAHAREEGLRLVGQRNSSK